MLWGQSHPFTFSFSWGKVQINMCIWFSLYKEAWDSLWLLGKPCDKRTAFCLAQKCSTWSLHCSGSACDTPWLFFSLFVLLSLAQKSFSCIFLSCHCSKVLFLRAIFYVPGIWRLASTIHFISQKFLAIPELCCSFLKSVTQSTNEQSFHRIQNSHRSFKPFFVPCNLIPAKYGLLKFNLWILLTFEFCEV